MMKNRYIMTALVMLCFSLAMPVSTLAVPAPIIASVTAIEIEEIVKKDISKLTPQILQDVIAGKIPQLKASIVRDIIIYGLGGGIVSMTPKDIQALIHLSIPKLSPSIVEDILRGKIPGIPIPTIEEMIGIGIRGGIVGMTPKDIQELIHINIPKLSPSIVEDILRGKIPGIDISTIEEMIGIGIRGGIVGITPKDIQALIQLNIPNLSPSIVKDILQGKFPGLDVGTLVELIKIGLLGGINGMTIDQFKEMLIKNIFLLPQDLIQDIIDGIFNGISWDDILEWLNSLKDMLLKCTLLPKFSEIPVLLPCFSKSCDSVLKCVMKKQRKTLEARLDDLINTIKANTKQTKHQTKIIEQEVLAYRRLEARVKKETLSLKEARYLSKKIKDSVSIGSTIETSKKGQ